MITSRSDDGSSPAEYDLRFADVGAGKPSAVAQLRIFSPVSSLPAFGSGYGSPDPSETYTLYGVSTDPSLLGIARGVFIFDDLGTGPVLGSVTVTLASSNGLPVVIDLNAAGFAAIQQSNGLFAFGGALTTLDPNRTTPEFIFGGTGGPNGAQLILSGSRVTVPEPAMLTFLSVALSGVVAVRRRTHGSPMHSRHRT